MRLLHIEGDAWGTDALSISLCEKTSADIPPYMILSHRWREGEVLFCDMISSNPLIPRSKKGYAKVEMSCRIALQMGLHYAWIDTCCMDKSSSAELSEAINSMYQYYARSNICFAYLDDVEDYPESEESFEGSCWFTRGWTLQELIAPKEMYFYSRGWRSLGTKSSLRNRLTTASRVAEKALVDPSCLRDFSVSEKMSWAAWRETTREEDESYSLMGIFGVNMPPLYGEGRERAFRRLQIEIMRNPPDHTLFAWNRRTNSGDMLATSIRDFLSPYSYSRMELDDYLDNFFALGANEPKLDYTMTNVGLHIELPITPIPWSRNLFLALLGCHENDRGSFVAVILQKRKFRGLTNSYQRICLNECSVLHLADADELHCLPHRHTIWISDTSGSGLSLSRLGHDVMQRDLCLDVNIYFGSFWRSYQESQSLGLVVSSGETFRITGKVARGKFETEIVVFWRDSIYSESNLIMAFGEINETLWIHVSEAGRGLASSLRRSWETLRKDFDFPEGYAWRHRRRYIKFYNQLLLYYGVAGMSLKLGEGFNEKFLGLTIFPISNDAWISIYARTKDHDTSRAMICHFEPSAFFMGLQTTKPPRTAAHGASHLEKACTVFFSISWSQILHTICTLTISGFQHCYEALWTLINV